MEITKDTGRVLFGFVSLYYDVGMMGIASSLDISLSSLNNYKRGHTKVKQELIDQVYEVYPKVKELMKVYEDQVLIKPKLDSLNDKNTALEILANNQAMIISSVEFLFKRLAKKEDN